MTQMNATLALYMGKYDAVEVGPVTKDECGEGTPGYQRVCEGDPGIVMWSVYLHLKEGGVECIADCPDKMPAILIGEALCAAFGLQRHFAAGEFKGYPIAGELFGQLLRLSGDLHSGNERERAFGQRLWSAINTAVVLDR